MAGLAESSTLLPYGECEEALALLRDARAGLSEFTLADLIDLDDGDWSEDDEEEPEEEALVLMERSAPISARALNSNRSSKAGWRGSPFSQSPTLAAVRNPSSSP